MRIEVIKNDDHFNVISDEGVAWQCGWDEALGVVVSWMLGRKLPYTQRGYSRWALRDEVEIAGLLTDQRVIGSTSMATHVPRLPIREVVREKQFPHL